MCLWGGGGVSDVTVVYCMLPHIHLTASGLVYLLSQKKELINSTFAYENVYLQTSFSCCCPYKWISEVFVISHHASVDWNQQTTGFVSDGTDHQRVNNWIDGVADTRRRDLP